MSHVTHIHHHAHHFVTSPDGSVLDYASAQDARMARQAFGWQREIEQQELGRLLHDLRGSAESDRRALAARVLTLRSVHRPPIGRVPWETLRDAPDPGGERHEIWAKRRDLAERVLSLDPFAYIDAVKACACLEEVREHVRTDGLVLAFEPTRAHADVRAPLDEAVPGVSTGARAVITSVAEHLDVYQDYVCGLSLRVARELLATLPIDEVAVDLWNVTRAPTPNDAGGGYREAAPRPTNGRIASMLCPRAVMESIDWTSADASDVVEMLAHEMDFRPGEGFYEVPQVTRR